MDLVATLVAIVFGVQRLMHIGDEMDQEAQRFSAHAIGQALYERIHYDDDGQLVTGSFVDYALPTAAELPSYETDRTETPSPVNSLGVKGVGEAGTIAASPAVTNAVIDALRPLGVTYINMPLSPMRVWQAIEEAKGGVAA